jgi:lipoyl(octanoyl) transferase
MIKWLPRPAEYQAVWHDMRAFTATRHADTADEIWLCEHAPVYTLGLAGKREHILNAGTIPVVHTDRGGQVTYHGPGQVVAYVLADLRRVGLYIREYVACLEDATLAALGDMGIQHACRQPGAPGVYVPTSAGLAKIAALGVKIRNGCAYHGVALNVDMDLSPFLDINPCGYAGLPTVDMASCGVKQDLINAGELLAAHLVRAIYP